MTQIIENKEKPYGTIAILTHPVSNSTLLLVGTCHFSHYSSNQVKNIIEKVQPEAIVLELDKERFNWLKINIQKPLQLIHSSHLSYEEVEPQADAFQVSFLEADRRHIPLYAVDFSLEQRMLVTEKRGVTPFEFFQDLITVYKISSKMNKKDKDTIAKVVQHEGLSLTQKQFIISNILVETTKLPKLNIMNEIFVLGPRNKYIASKLYDIGSTHSPIVGVFGEAHIEGIVEEFNKIHLKQKENQSIFQNIFRKPVHVVDSVYIKPRFYKEQWVLLGLTTIYTTFVLTRKIHNIARRRVPYLGNFIVPLGIPALLLIGSIRIRNNS